MNDESFRTKVELKRQSLITPEKKLVSLGSCFAEVLGRKLEEAQFAISVNPFGTLFHPYSLFEALSPSATLSDSLYRESLEMVQHYRLPKTFFASTRKKFQRQWSDRHAELQEDLSGEAILLLTLGTSFLYERQGQWVANCLKQPASEFTKALKPFEAMKDRWQDLFPKLPKALKIIVTVSPVRHLKDGLSDNSLSKSLLRVLADSMVATDPSRIFYFPAFEIMVDELRDYRFYKRDMLHPSPLAGDYIAKIFQDHYFSDDAKKRMREWEKLRARRDHRSLHPESEEARIFQEKLMIDIKNWNETSPQRLSRRPKS